MDYIQDLNWRYAVKKFDGSKKIKQSDYDVLKESIRLAPSSYGLQPLEVLIVENDELKAQLVEHSYNQKQVEDCDKLFVFCIYKHISSDHVNAYINNIASTRKIPAENLSDFHKTIQGSIDGRSDDELKVWASKQCYIAMSNLLSACAHLKIDSCPMEGFVASGYDKVLGLSDMNLEAAVVTPVGYRSSEDIFAANTKVRKSHDDLFKVI